MSRDLDRLGQDAKLVGRWCIWARDAAWVELRSDGTIVDVTRRDLGRWAGSGDILVTHEREVRRWLHLVVYVRGGYPLDDPALDGWWGFGHSEECLQSVFVRRDE